MNLFILKLRTRLFILSSLFVLLAVCSQTATAQDSGGFGLTPMRCEVEIPAGTEKTFPLRVNYTPGINKDVNYPALRIVARMEDWTMQPDGEVIFSPIGTRRRSAATWAIFSPAEFVIKPDTSEFIRVTVSVPKDTKPGDYYFALYIEDRNPPPIAKPGEKLLHLRFRFYSMIYVMVPGLTREGTLEGLETKVVDGMPLVSPKLANKGNSHLRPIQSFEIRDEANKIVAEMKPKDLRPVLGESALQMKLGIKEELPAGKYSVTYRADFGRQQPILVGKTNFEITSADVVARNKAKASPNNVAVQNSGGVKDTSVKDAAAPPPATAESRKTTEKVSPLTASKPTEEQSPKVAEKTSSEAEKVRTALTETRPPQQKQPKQQP